MNSIERVKHYTEIDTEAAFDDNDPKGRTHNTQHAVLPWHNCSCCVVEVWFVLANPADP